MVSDDRHRRLLGQHREAIREGHADFLEVEQSPDLLMLRLVRACGVAPRVAAPLVAGEAELAASFGVQPLGEPLGRLHPEAVNEELFSELALVLEALDELRD